ncbi:hypothetical protein [Nesterenkonia alba]|uniref:hypothetical protein n=1 Tax=Nesterenkonia alba TaxID=515814 RepID=UPI0003B54EC3|nr:hypothetical protein [Nesterenkonia alba]
MRQLFSLLFLLTAALLSAAGLAGHQIDQLLRDEEPIRHIAGDLPEQEHFSEAVGSMMVDELAERVPSQAQGLIGDQVEGLVTGLIADVLESDRTRTAWDETLQTTRSDYAEQLETLFAEGSSGDPRELDVELDLTPLTEAMTEPLREGLTQTLGWLPFLDETSFDVLAPEIVVDVEAATDEQADPYTWATLAGISQYWVWFFVAAGVLLLAGVLLGPGRFRWAALSFSAAVAAGIGLWIALTVASPRFEQPPGADPATLAILDHVQHRVTEWAQPGWWVFTGVAGFLALAALVAAVATPSARRR